MKSFCLKSLAIVCMLACSSVFAQGSGTSAMEKYNELVNAGIFTDTGGGNDQSQTNTPMPPRDAAAIIALLADLDTNAEPATPEFSDVSTDQPWYGYVEAAVQAGLIIGDQDTPTYTPADEFSPEELVQLYTHALQDSGLFDSQGNNSAITQSLATLFDQLTETLNATIPPNPEAPPGPDILQPLLVLPGEQVIPPSAGGGNDPDDPDDPDTQLVLAENNTGNEITLDDMMNQAVDDTITGSMIGTYTGGLSGEIAGDSVGGTISLAVGLTGADYFNGSVTFNSGVSGTVKLDMYNAHDGTFSSSGVISSDPILATSSVYSVTDMTVNGSAIGANAKGNWTIDLDNPSGPGATGNGSFTATNK